MNKMVNKMDNRSWKDKKNEICKIIKQISDYYGSDDVIWLREYAKEVIDKNKDNLQAALECFEDLWKQCDNKCIK